MKIISGKITPKHQNYFGKFNGLEIQFFIETKISIKLFRWLCKKIWCIILAYITSSSKIYSGLWEMVFYICQINELWFLSEMEIL